MAGLCEDSVRLAVNPGVDGARTVPRRRANVKRPFPVVSYWILRAWWVSLASGSGLEFPGQRYRFTHARSLSHPPPTPQQQHATARRSFLLSTKDMPLAQRRHSVHTKTPRYASSFTRPEPKSAPSLSALSGETAWPWLSRRVQSSLGLSWGLYEQFSHHESTSLTDDTRKHFDHPGRAVLGIYIDRLSSPKRMRPQAGGVRSRPLSAARWGSPQTQNTLPLLTSVNDTQDKSPRQGRAPSSDKENNHDSSPTPG